MSLQLFEYVFWIALFITFYAYLGYGVLLFLLIKLKRLFGKKEVIASTNYEPMVTLLVAAYNEQDYIEDKIKNSLALDYPKEKLELMFVSDGSDDDTPAIVRRYDQVNLLHQPERRGKIAAVERVMPLVKGEFVIFTDANTMLNPEAVRMMIRHYRDENVGAIAGEKRISQKEKDVAAGAGEGMYWKYESALKTWDSELKTVVGAAGELFSVRTSIYEPVPKDSLIEDFYMTMKIAQKGFKVVYEPEAYAVENSSASVQEELKRKIRIAAGGIQSVIRLRSLLNPFKYGVLCFQYVSHRVLRWTLAPLALPVILTSNVFLALDGNLFYLLTLVAQVLFYLLGIIGYLTEKRAIKIKVLFIPYYFSMMNYAVYRGFIRYIKGNQSVVWEKAKRSK